MKKIDPKAPITPQLAEWPVLYVEDEPSNWEVTELRLRKKYKLLWAKSDLEAVGIVKQFSGQFLAVLMDVQLKGSVLDGIKLTQLFRGKLPASEVPAYAKDLPLVKCPVFFVTAYGNLYTPQQMTEAGGDGHVPKPVDFLKLTLTLAETSAKRALQTLEK
ncbi:MAG: response regulator [Myxococcaceae bacterium]